MRITLFVLLFFLFVVQTSLVFGQESNAGIVRGLWFANGSPFANKETRIYVAIRNNTGSDLTGTIDFFDGEKKLERKQIQALDGRIIESWTNWTPTYGTHTLAVNLSRTQLFAVGSTTQEVEVVSASTQDTVFVDFDTDDDGVGNTIDQDDDADGTPDAKEIQQGTDPLLFDVTDTPRNEKVQKTEQVESTEVTGVQENRNNTNEKPQGLEQYLAPSRGEDILTGVTNIITASKQKLDVYREKRNAEKVASSSLPTVSVDGFGEITRTDSPNKRSWTVPSFDGNGFFDKLFSGIGKALNWLYTFMLATLSLILGHPIFIQLGILVLILFLLVRFAAKYGRRPRSYSK